MSRHSTDPQGAGRTMRVAYFSPLPPDPSGIADYSFELLEELRELVDVTAIVRGGAVRSKVPDGVAIAELSDFDQNDYDVAVYQMGNHPRYHAYMFRPALEDPGLLVLHDPSLADFHAAICGGFDNDLFREELSYDSGDPDGRAELPTVDLGGGRHSIDRSRVLLARRLINASSRTLVHSGSIASSLRTRYQPADVRSIMLPARVISSRGAHSPDELGFTFGAFGGINHFKRLDSVLRAFSTAQHAGPRARLLIAGRVDEPEVADHCRAVVSELALDDSVEIRTDLSLTSLESAILECNVAICLRWPSAGEMSATLMRAFGAGKPAIVSDLLQFRDLDPEFCWRVDTDPACEQQELVEVMQSALRDPDGCEAAGKHAREFVLGAATIGTVARDYVAHLSACRASQGDQIPASETPS
jgi:glycosyltransferase involved in cell wall biosynthesis